MLHQNEIEESELLFKFDAAHWQTIVYDKHQCHEKINSTEAKAIDFLSIYDQKTVVLFEIKNFRGHRIENKSRTENATADLVLEVAQKVRDSIAGMIGAVRDPLAIETEFWKTIGQLITKPKKEIIVIAWLEEDTNTSQIMQKRGKSGK